MFEEAQQKVANAFRQMQARLNQNANNLWNQFTSVRNVTKANQSIANILNRIKKQ
jgi:flagellar capping protein FliD